MKCGECECIFKHLEYDICRVTRKEIDDYDKCQIDDMISMRDAANGVDAAKRIENRIFELRRNATIYDSHPHCGFIGDILREHADRLEREPEAENG